MWIKLLGICLVCVSCAGIGGGEALRLIGRRRFLEEVKRIATGLRGEIGYTQAVLPLALCRAGARGDGKDGTAAVSPSDNSGQSYLEYGAHRSRRGGGGIVGTYSGAVKNIFPLRRDGSGNLGICGGVCVFSETITTGE